MTASATHLVLIPSFNTGPRLLRTVREALAVWSPVWVVVDGSDDGSDTPVSALATELGHQRLRVFKLPNNSGKGAAVLHGLGLALAEKFTHALVLDADGQHPIDHIAPFMAASAAQPECLILGRPVFGPEVPLERLYGRKLSVGLVHLECLGRDIGDPLFGFRVYPVAPTHAALSALRSARRYDFDPEIAVRLFWRGVPPLNLPAPCRYIAKADGGVSHFHYVRDNLRMIWLHTRLLLRLLVTFPAILATRRRLHARKSSR
ncbi:MAG: glycosyltransferase family 2 protein [Verrucomicrobia bacterium]|nr:glycosyltransferase family 2 protein [Verrucomicrobiota bacterium]